jgi:hypothetical protein
MYNLGYHGDRDHRGQPPSEFVDYIRGSGRIATLMMAQVELLTQRNRQLICIYHINWI